MGNDSSVLSEYEIQPKCYAKVGQWNLHVANIKDENESQVTVFTVKLKSYGQLTKEFERSVESLKTMRHPTILRYLNSCIASEYAYLFVEFVTPLKSVLKEQTETEICSGLQNILVALDFIHSKANVVHNNVCQDAIFVTNSGQWKLGFFDCSCSLNELNPGFLNQIRSIRYDKAVAPEDEGKGKLAKEIIPTRDIFAYGQLVKETIGKCIDSGVSNSTAFLELACKQMQNTNPQLRGTAMSLSKHIFFDQPLLRAQEFLSEIAIKSSAEKEVFFKNLPSILYSVPEEVVSKLANLLLSRMVVLNPVAQEQLLPHLLIPRTDTTQGLFDANNYRRFIVPVIAHIFPVRDAQIRLLLLQYFPYYVQLMDEHFLVQKLLPELLLGIKDTDDLVVSATLRALADLVPFLGGTTVIGGRRLKLFANGTPKIGATESGTPKKMEARQKSFDTSVVRGNHPLPERLEPDGGEDGSCPEDSAQPLGDDTDDRWSDWEAEDPVVSTPVDPISNPVVPSEPEIPPVPIVKKLDDLSALDIQVSIVPPVEEIDFFADMEPTITKTVQVELGAVAAAIPNPSKEPQLNFSVQPQEEEEELANDGWNWDD